MPCNSLAMPSACVAGRRPSTAYPAVILLHLLLNDEPRRQLWLVAIPRHVSESETSAPSGSVSYTSVEERREFSRLVKTAAQLLNKLNTLPAEVSVVRLCCQ